METDALQVVGPTKATGSRTRIRLRAVQAALSVALLDAIPGGTEVANWIGIDPLAHAKQQMFRDLGNDASGASVGFGRSARVSPVAAKHVTRGFVRVAKGALKGTRYAAILAKRGALVVTVVASVTSGVSAYREMTAVGFAALGDA